jgi:hypothetical protein
MYGGIQLFANSNVCDFRHRRVFGEYLQIHEALCLSILIEKAWEWSSTGEGSLLPRRIYELDEEVPLYLGFY